MLSEQKFKGLAFPFISRFPNQENLEQVSSTFSEPHGNSFEFNVSTWG